MSTQNMTTANDSFSIDSNGIWHGLNKKNVMDHHVHDFNLCNSIIELLTNENPETVGDFGCGLGFYTHQLKKSGINSFGYDGSPNTYELTNGSCSVLELHKPFRFPKPFDWVLCLEVGEHIPKQFESIFIDNLHHNSSKGIILSWAIKGQGGDGHVNCQNNDYVESQFQSLGYALDLDAQTKLRNDAFAPYFKRTIMVFRKL